MGFIRGYRESHNEGENHNKEENQNQPPRKPLLILNLPKKNNSSGIYRLIRYFRGNPVNHNPDVSKTVKFGISNLENL